MATSGGIIVMDTNGDFIPSYIHYDCFADRVIPILKNHYPTLVDALTLVDGGDMSGLYETVATSKYYVRDRGESFEDSGFRSFKSFVEAYDDLEDRGAAVVFLFDGHWLDHAVERDHIHSPIINDREVHPPVIYEDEE